MNFGFYRINAKWLWPPFLMCLASGFGQTYFIALFGPYIREDFGISHGAWGTIYMLGTLASALSVMRFGEWADRMSARVLASGLLLAFSFFAFLMAFNSFLWALPILIFGLRFCGQGMLTHLSQVVTARWFVQNRGKAMAATSIGVGTGEAIFPMIFVGVIAGFGWRSAWALAGILLLVFLILLRQLLSQKRIPQSVGDHSESAGMFGKSWTRSEMLHHWVFWLAWPALVTLPFCATVFFFQLPVLAQSKNWGLDEVALRIPILTISAFFGLMGGGVMIDRVGLIRLMPWIYLPIILGYFVLSGSNSLLVFSFAIALVGLSQGLNAAMGGVFWPEFYGTKHMGAIRAVGSSLVVFSTAIGPMLSGWALDWGVHYDVQLLFLAGYAAFASLALWVVSRRSRGAFEG